MGINKTLQLLKKGYPKFELSQIEGLLRKYSRVKRRKCLPYLVHDAIPSYESTCVDVVSDDPITPKQFIVPGGFDEYDELRNLILRDERTKQVKGAGPCGSSRASLDRWILDNDTAALILDGPCGDSDKGRRLKTIRAHSMALADVLEVMSGRRKVLPKVYPGEIEKEIRGNARKDVEEILRISLSVPKARLDVLRSDVALAKQKLAKHDLTRAQLASDLLWAEICLKKWEAGKPINT